MSERTTDYRGIDYSGHSGVNRDKASGIRYGVINQNDVGDSWFDSAEANYGEPHCPYCGNEVLEYSKAKETLNDDIDAWPSEPYECDDFACLSCKRLIGNESAFPDEPSSYSYEADGYAAECGEDGDIFILKSPYFTYAQFCSPCAPGACYLMNPLSEPDNDNRAYCFGHDWFENGVAPYPVYSVETGEKVESTMS